MTLDGHLDEYKRDGYTVFRGYLSAAKIKAWRDLMDRKFAQLLANARARNDRRMLRFFAADSAFMSRQEASWALMVEQDTAALRPE